MKGELELFINNPGLFATIWTNNGLYYVCYRLETKCQPLKTPLVKTIVETAVFGVKV